MSCNRLIRRVLALALVATLVMGCGGGAGSAMTPAQPPAQPSGNNVLIASVDAGPAGSGYNVNRLYVDVKICRPGSSECRIIDHVLVDTGSTGLRLLSSAIQPALSLERTTNSTGLPLLNCVQFVDNTFAWGPVVTADVVLAGKTAASVPIQVMADPAFGNVPMSCSGGGAALITSADLGANGILGVGLFKEDCGAACGATLHNGFYYTCTSASCASITGVKVSLAQQLKNPVSQFATDNNGVLIDLPAAGPGTSTGLKGALIFGVATQSNNQTGAARLLTTSADGYFTTLLLGQVMASSFMDTGSNGLYFDSNSIPVCAVSTGFYCPTSQTSLSAALVGANQVQIAVSFSIDNATAMFGDPSRAVLPALAGPFGNPDSFDWGLPSFYGRRVFIGIEGQSSSLGSGPYYAF